MPALHALRFARSIRGWWRRVLSRSAQPERRLVADSAKLRVFSTVNYDFDSKLQEHPYRLPANHGSVMEPTAIDVCGEATVANIADRDGQIEYSPTKVRSRFFSLALDEACALWRWY